MGSLKNNILTLSSNNTNQEEIIHFCECYGLKVDTKISGAIVCYEELEEEELDKLFKIANKLFKNICLHYEENEANSNVDWYSGYEITYNENNDGKKQIKEYDYCVSDFEANGINGWEILKDTIEEKAKKKNIEICWSDNDELYPEGDYGDEFYDLCEKILEKHGGLEGLSTKKTKIKIKDVPIYEDDLKKIINNASDFGYNSLIDKIKNMISEDDLELKNKKKNAPKNKTTKKSKTNLDLDKEKIEKKIFKKLEESGLLSSVEEWCENHGQMDYFEKLLERRDFILVAIDSFGDNFYDYFTHLNNDEEIVLRAIISSGNNLEYASDRLKNDRNFIKTVLEKNGYALKYAIEKFKSDRELVKIAIQNYGLAFQYASEELRGDKELALIAVSWKEIYPEKGGSMLKFVSDELKNDKDVVDKAISNDPEAIKYI